MYGHITHSKYSLFHSITVSLIDGVNYMDYPGNFETPSFPAGRGIAVSRLMAICALVAFLLVVFLCGILVWSSRSVSLVPFLISTNNDTGEWTLVGRTSETLEYSATRTIQESVIGNFARDWFLVSDNIAENDKAWKKCEREECAASDAVMFGTRDCAIYCAAGDDVYSRFSYDIVPDYKSRTASGEIVELDEQSMVISPAGRISENGGTWQFTATVYSSVRGSMSVKAFVKIARNDNNFPQTMGFYIADFNAYRMN